MKSLAWAAFQLALFLLLLAGLWYYWHGERDR